MKNPARLNKLPVVDPSR